MFFLAYFLIAALIIAIGLFAIMLRVNPHGRWRNPRRRLLGYLLGALAIVILGAVIFTAVSTSVGLMAFGVAQDFNFPADYFAAGGAGIGLLVLLALLLLSPLALAARLQKPDKNMDKFGPKREYQPAKKKRK